MRLDMGFSIQTSAIAKFLDQPALVKKMTKSVNIALPSIALGYSIYDTFKAPEQDRKKTFIKDVSVLSFTVLSALVATRGLKFKGKKILPGLMHDEHIHSHKHEHIHHHSHDGGMHEHHKHEINLNKAHYDNELDEIMYTIPELKSKELIYKVKNGKILSIEEIKKLTLAMNNRGGISKIIPDIHSHSPFEELANLSWIGLLPVVGGVCGGIVGDMLTKDKWKEKLPNKIKEGTYQYLNNIFLCNVGAGLAMFVMNKLKVKNKMIRIASMLTGVVAVGLVAGSAIANYIGKKFINPIFDKNLRKENEFPKSLKDLNSERHPEALDLSLHIDDIASVGFMSGVKWIGPILPALYSISAYRAGIGYRNAHDKINK